MTGRITATVFLVVAVVVSSGSASAALINNGGGLIYDTSLNITWYDYNPGPMTWSEAMSWASTLTVGNTAAGTWSLPTTPGTAIGFVDEGQMAELYYDELQGVAGGPLTDTSPFTTLQLSFYWSSTSFPNYAWYFYFGGGLQAPGYEGYSYYALAVHSGDVGAPVPIPGAVLLFTSGLVLLATTRRRSKN